MFDLEHAFNEAKNNEANNKAELLQQPKKSEKKTTQTKEQEQSDDEKQEQSDYEKREQLTTAQFCDINKQRVHVLDWWCAEFLRWAIGPNNYPRYNKNFNNDNQMSFEVINIAWKEWKKWKHEATITSHGWMSSTIKYEHGWRVLIDCWWDHYLQFHNSNEIHNALYVGVQMALLANFLKSEVKWWKDIFAQWYQVFHDRTWPLNELLIWAKRMKWLLTISQGKRKTINHPDWSTIKKVEWSFWIIDKKDRSWSTSGREDISNNNWFNSSAVKLMKTLVTIVNAT